MKNSSIVTPKVAEGFVSRRTNLGVDSYDLDELYSPDTGFWKSKVLDLGSPKYPPQIASAPTRYWFDRSRYNNHGTITGATWKQLPSGVWVLSFDGTDDSINCGSAAVLDITGNISIIAWANPDDLGDGYIVGKGDNNVSPNTTYNLGLGVVSASKWTFFCAAGGAGTWIASSGNATALAWSCVGVTFNPTTNDAILYLNGAQDNTATITGNPASKPSDILYVGARQDNTLTSYWDGLLAPPVIVSSILTASEMKQYYQQTKWGYQK